MVLGLKVPQPQSQGDSGLLAHTLDISSSGAKVGALRSRLQPGSVLIVQRGHTRARCLVIWSRELAPQEVQIGIKFLDRDAHLWNLDLEDDCGGVWFSDSGR
jgi:hypothetical protein